MTWPHQVNSILGNCNKRILFVVVVIVSYVMYVGFDHHPVERVSKWKPLNPVRAAGDGSIKDAASASKKNIKAWNSSSLSILSENRSEGDDIDLQDLTNNEKKTRDHTTGIPSRYSNTSCNLTTLWNGSVFQNLRLAAKRKTFTGMLNKCGYEQRLPDVINIGVKKSGTTMFRRYFTQHPQIAPALDNEVHFFDWKYDKGIEYYRSRMMFASSDMLSYEKTPRYFRTEDAPLHMVKDLPDHLKFIILVKDPVKRAISEFRHESQLKIKKLKHGSNHLPMSTERSEGIRFENEVIGEDGEVNSESEIIDTSLYSKHFQNWLQYYPRDRFLIIEYDSLMQNISHWLQKVESFLGLRSYFQPEMFKLNNKGRLCFISPQKSHKKVCPGSKGKLPKAKPSEEILLKLCHYFQPYNKMFMRLTNMTFNWTCDY